MATPANKLSVRSNAGKWSAKSPKPVVERVACSVVEHATRSVLPTIPLTTPFIKPEAPNGGRGRSSRRSGIRKDGVAIHVSVSLSPIRNEAGAVTGVSKISRDVTERVQLLARESAARREAEDAARVKR